MDIDNLAINQTLPAITCDYQSLRHWAESITKKYDGLIVQEDDIKAIKSDMAELNKAKQKLERARIDTVKAISAPIREFEAQIKDISGLFDAAYKQLAAQLKIFEDAEKDKKLQEIKEVISVECKFNNINPETIPFNNRWLNKTVSINSIRNDINALIQAQKRMADNPLIVLANESAAQGDRDVGAESIARMETQIAHERATNPLIVWRMVFSYKPEQEQEIRKIFQECQFMKIVRLLNSIGIKAEIAKENN